MRGGLIFTVGLWCVFGLMYFAHALGHHLPLPPPPEWISGFACLAYAAGLVFNKEPGE